MIIFDLLGWWYLEGWRGFGRTLIEKMRGALSFFSLGALLRTLFAPFRQISANEGGAALQVFLDRLVSRLVGAVVRIFLMIVGIVVFVLEAILSVLLMIAWPLVPLLPVICVVLTVMGVSL